MRKIIALILAICLAIVPFTLTGCSILDGAFDAALIEAENEELKQQIKDLEAENEELKQQIAQLKFDIAFPNGIIDKDCVINYVERTITSESEEVDAISIQTAINVTINGGKFDGGQTALGSAGNTAIFVNNPEAKLIITGGEFTINGLAAGDTGHIDLIYCKQGTIEITGGTFKGENDTVWLLNCRDEFYTNGVAKIIVKGGTFVNWNPANCISEGEDTSFIAEGYKVVIEVVDETTTLYKVVEMTEEELNPTPVEPETPAIPEF